MALSALNILGMIVKAYDTVHQSYLREDYDWLDLNIFLQLMMIMISFLVSTLRLYHLQLADSRLVPDSATIGAFLPAHIGDPCYTLLLIFMRRNIKQRWGFVGFRR